MEVDAPGGIVASILTHFTYRKGEVEMIGVPLRTAGQQRAIKSLLINFLSAEDINLEFLLRIYKIRATAIDVEDQVSIIGFKGCLNSEPLNPEFRMVNPDHSNPEHKNIYRFLFRFLKF